MERLVSKMTYLVSSGTLNPTHLLTHCVSGWKQHLPSCTTLLLVRT